MAALGDQREEVGTEESWPKVDLIGRKGNMSSSTEKLQREDGREDQPRGICEGRLVSCHGVVVGARRPQTRNQAP
jgi:hypothetical protein